MFLKGHLAMSRDIFGCPNWENDATDTKEVEARNAIIHPTMPRKAHHQKELSRLRTMPIILSLRNPVVGIKQIESK